MGLDVTTFDHTSTPFRANFRDLPPLQTSAGDTKAPQQQSIRERPSQILEKQHAAPLTPVISCEHQHQLRQRGSKMSLFGLFSRPKVEKQRGYTEQGVALPQQQKDAAASKASLVVHVQPNNAAPPRAASAMSFTNASRAAVEKLKFKEQPPLPRERRSGPWDPPPLFQAYPQATKHGVAEVSTSTPETVLSKSKPAKGLQVPAEHAPRGSQESSNSGETKRTSKTAMRHIANGSVAHIDLPRKIFVLVTSGYLLQYAENGPSDRLPEKALQLGKDSAAFACDLIPGKHYVLQISQAVNSQGVVIANTGGILSKLGIRSASSKRTTSSCLMVLPSADEMDSWLVHVRREIEALGGKKVRPDMSVRTKTGEGISASAEPRRTPSQSHRYQIKRDPSRVSVVGTPVDGLPDLPMPPQRETLPDSPRPDTGAEEQPKNSLEEIEAEAAKISLDVSPSRKRISRMRSSSDAQSVRSSTGTSVDQQHLDNLRRNSIRGSHGTSSTARTSRANSLTSSPPPDLTTKANVESQDRARTMSSFRHHLTSYASSRRRSAIPTPATRDMQTQSRTDLDTQQPESKSLHPGADYLESHIAGRNAPPPPPKLSPRKRLSILTAHTTLQEVKDEKVKHDWNFVTSPTIAENGERPDSFVGDLPPPSTWQPSKRASNLHCATPQQTQRMSSVPAIRTSEPYKPRRLSSQPFSLPLKINPSTPDNRPPSRSGKRTSIVVNDTQEPVGEPQVFTLEAKVDPRHHRLSIKPLPREPSASPKPDVPSKTPSRSASQRLSLFPSSIASPPTQQDNIKRSPSATSPGFAPAQANGNTLKRPISMQIRSDHAPFLSSVRNSVTGSAAGRSFTAPIRGLKPSRSATNMTTLAEATSPTDPFHKTSQATVSESEDKATPLPSRAASPLLVRPPSRNSFTQHKGLRGLKTRSSLPALDLGIPVVGLGPPAPPPNAPLPPPPPPGSSSRPTSPMPGAVRVRSNSRSTSPMPAPTGLRNHSRPTSPMPGAVRMRSDSRPTSPSPVPTRMRSNSRPASPLPPPTRMRSISRPSSPMPGAFPGDGMGMGSLNAGFGIQVS